MQTENHLDVNDLDNAPHSPTGAKTESGLTSPLHATGRKHAHNAKQQPRPTAWQSGISAEVMAHVSGCIPPVRPHAVKSPPPEAFLNQPSFCSDVLSGSLVIDSFVDSDAMSKINRTHALLDEAAKLWGDGESDFSHTLGHARGFLLRQANYLLQGSTLAISADVQELIDALVGPDVNLVDVATHVKERWYVTGSLYRKWRRQHKTGESLPESDAFLISAFTAEPTNRDARRLYSVVNNALLSGTVPRALTPLIDSLNSSLLKLDCKRIPMAFRGLRVGSEILESAFKGESWLEGDSLHFQSFNSFTHRSEIAAEFVKNADKSIMLMALDCTFRDITHYSCYRLERELLDATPTSYVVVKRVPMVPWKQLLVIVAPPGRRDSALAVVTNDGEAVLDEDGGATQPSQHGDGSASTTNTGGVGADAAGPTSSPGASVSPPSKNAVMQAALTAIYRLHNPEVGPQPLRIGDNDRPIPVCFNALTCPTLRLVGRQRSNPNSFILPSSIPEHVQVSRKRFALIESPQGFGKSIAGWMLASQQPMINGREGITVFVRAKDLAAHSYGGVAPTATPSERSSIVISSIVRAALSDAPTLAEDLVLLLSETDVQAHFVVDGCHEVGDAPCALLSDLLEVINCDPAVLPSSAFFTLTTRPMDEETTALSRKLGDHALKLSISPWTSAEFLAAAQKLLNSTLNLAPMFIGTEIDSYEAHEELCSAAAGETAPSRLSEVVITALSAACPEPLHHEGSSEKPDLPSVPSPKAAAPDSAAAEPQGAEEVLSPLIHMSNSSSSYTSRSSFMAPSPLSTASLHEQMDQPPRAPQRQTHLDASAANSSWSPGYSATMNSSTTLNSATLNSARLAALERSFGSRHARGTEGETKKNPEIPPASPSNEAQK